MTFHSIQEQRAPRNLRRARALAVTALSPLLLMGAEFCAADPAFAQTVALPAQPSALAPGAVQAGGGTRHRRRSPRAPESSSQGQVTNAKTVAPNAGIFPFIPPYATTLPGGGPFSIDSKGISAATDDKAVQFRIGGRYQYDFSSVQVRPAFVTKTLPTDNDSRRAYFESFLTLSSGFSAVFQYDFANATQKIVDAAVAYQAPQTRVIYSIGNFKEPFSLNELQSDNNTTFTERSLMDSLTPARSFGGSIGAYGDKWTIAGGVFGGNANLGIEDNGVAGTVRVTYAPILTPPPTQVLHLGVAGSYRSLDATGLALSFSAHPEDFLERSLISTGALGKADAIGRVNAEVLYQIGSYRIQGEYTYANVEGRAGQADRSFQGGYVEGGWVLNGAGRPYRVAANYGTDFAVLQGVQVENGQRISQGGFGVFEAAARYSALDLQTTGVRGGSEQDATAGLNWYPDRNLKVMTDYVHAWVQPTAFSVGKSRNVESDAVVAPHADFLVGPGGVVSQFEIGRR